MIVRIPFRLLLIMCQALVSTESWVLVPKSIGSSKDLGSKSSTSKRFFWKRKNKRQQEESTPDASSSAGFNKLTFGAPGAPQPEDVVLFDQFKNFLVKKQEEIVNQLEKIEPKARFTRDTWGLFEPQAENSTPGSRPLPAGGITRVLQGGNVIDKGACSLTLINEGTLTADRAASIRSRQDIDIQTGDKYAACALSMVLHTKSPMVPTFRSDVRVFLVQTKDNKCLAWFGGGADLTPYILFEDDIRFFHQCYKDLCDQNPDPLLTYQDMKEECDEYFYLPARQEHRGTGGIFFDDLTMTNETLDFTKGVANAWMPSWLPIVEKRRNLSYSKRQKQWQLLRRGRYLEFNLLYDRGVKFGLANANPRVEGVMVSAPPLIAYEYNHIVEKGSEEEKLLKVLKKPKDWLGVLDLRKQV